MNQTGKFLIPLGVMAGFCVNLVAAVLAPVIAVAGQAVDRTVFNRIDFANDLYTGAWTIIGTAMCSCSLWLIPSVGFGIFVSLLIITEKSKNMLWGFICLVSAIAALVGNILLFSYALSVGWSIIPIPSSTILQTLLFLFLYLLASILLAVINKHFNHLQSQFHS